MDENVTRHLLGYAAGPWTVTLPDPASVPVGTTIGHERQGRVERWTVVRRPVEVVGGARGEVTWHNEWVPDPDLAAGGGD